MPGCSASDIDYLPAGYADDTAAAAAGTVSETAADADADSDSDIPVGDQACLAETNCLRNVDGWSMSEKVYSWAHLPKRFQTSFSVLTPGLMSAMCALSSTCLLYTSP